MSQVVANQTDQWQALEDENAARLERASVVFPLPLTPFERYMLVDDRPDYPMTYGHVIDLKGKLDRAAMELAVSSALARHPLTCAKVRRLGTQDHWVAGQLPREPVTWHEAPPPRLPFGGEHVDLFQECGVRIDGFSGDETPYLVFSTHHAVTDGLGLVQIVSDTLAAYGKIIGTGEKLPRLSEPDPTRLRGRGDYEVTIPHPVSRATVLRSMVSEAWKIFSRQATLITSRAGSKSAAEVQRNYAVVTVEDEALTPIRTWASENNATLNQILVRDLFVALEQWTSQQPNRSGRWLRLAIPTSLRSRNDRKTPATNILGYLFLTRRQSECRHRSQLLEGIIQELEFAEQWAMGTMFSAAVAAVDRLPGVLHFFTRRRRRLVSAVLSNLGEVTRRFSAKLPRVEGKVVTGGLELENVTAAPPIRSGTSLALAVTGCSGKLNFCAQYDTRLISEPEVREFLESYVQIVLQGEDRSAQRTDERDHDQAGR